MAQYEYAATIYKVTINQSLHVDQYPLPKTEELFALLAEGKRFSKLVLAHAPAYQQVSLVPRRSSSLSPWPRWWARRARGMSRGNFVEARRTSGTTGLRHHDVMSLG